MERLVLSLSSDPNSSPRRKFLPSCFWYFSRVKFTTFPEPAASITIPHELCLILLFRARCFITITIMTRRKPKPWKTGRNTDNNYNGTNSNNPQRKYVDSFPQKRDHLNNCLVSSRHRINRDNNHISDQDPPLPNTRHSDPSNSRHDNVQTSLSDTDPIRDLDNEKYHRTIRSIFDEGSALEIRLGRFFENLTRLLQPQADEMDWEFSNQTYIVMGKADVPALRAISWGSAGTQIANISQEVEKSPPWDGFPAEAAAAGD